MAVRSVFDPDSMDDEEEYVGAPRAQEPKEQVKDMIGKIEIGDGKASENEDIRKVLLDYTKVFTKKQNEGIEGMEHKPIRQRPYKTFRCSFRCSFAGHNR